MEKNNCQHCKYEWPSRVDNPKQCPKCKRYDWKKNSEEEVEDVFG